MSGLDRDSLYRFVFEQHDVRGELVHLDASFAAALSNHPYTPLGRRVLGHALAAVALLTSILKFDGRLTMQLQGEGAVRLLVAQCTSQLALRGLVHVDEGADNEVGLSDLAGKGRLAITIEPDEGQRYQGIVPLQGATLATCLEAYFERSEQLPTRLWIAASENAVVGMMLQRLPEGNSGPRSSTRDEDAWNRLTTLASTITDEELLTLANQDILHRLFHEEDVRLFERDPVSFRCSCSRERFSDALRGLGLPEVTAIVREEGDVSTTCEFCNKSYVFDSVDVAALFQDATGGPSTTEH